MKKFLIAILAIVYVTTAMGATVHFHYCMDKLVAWDLGKKGPAKKSCSNCGMKKTSADKHCHQETKGCCKDEQKLVKLADDQKITSGPVHQVPVNIEGVSLVYPEYSFGILSSDKEQNPYANSPPPPAMSLFLLNCVFRI
ncbi:MAG: HYC_CC_PP family protein [Chitinophagaceae bacterium]